ncbi:hypothetical protein [Thiobacillus thioparus]|uniref:hypothetical protein n=1 Tax=Thiobacillus thioparus TaxID=931 RepID=UPI00036FAE91|nr:hypothetical protein [Thiobacillus thioparus]
MKHWKISTLFALSLLTGCASTDVALSSADKPEAGAGTLKIGWSRFSSVQIRLDGKIYVGEWRDSRCFTRECLGEFRNIQRIYRKHIRKGAAELVAKDNTCLNCEWGSHGMKVIGACRADDGRVYHLQAG